MPGAFLKWLFLEKGNLGWNGTHSARLNLLVLKPRLKERFAHEQHKYSLSIISQEIAPPIHP
jgi:hypothetical protein